MARKLRIEYEHALYHVINRGNYRTDVFASEGAKAAFEQCLFEASRKSGWVLHAFVVMRNHYHLALETPQANLVAGMRWLQSTYANRFNRLRQEHGHVFQGRYHAIVLEDGAALGAVCHYIHLNPVRAGVQTVEDLGEYRHCSFRWLLRRRERPSFLDLSTCLEAAGGLKDTPAGRRSYQHYLAWLAEDEPARKALGFEKMSRGWAHGTKAFKQALREEHKVLRQHRASFEAETTELRELAWDELVRRCLGKLRQHEGALAASRKAAAWKVAIATHMRTVTTATNAWLASRLCMGAPDGVSRYCAECRSGERAEAAKLLARISNIRV